MYSSVYLIKVSLFNKPFNVQPSSIVMLPDMFNWGGCGRGGFPSGPKSGATGLVGLLSSDLLGRLVWRVRWRRLALIARRMRVIYEARQLMTMSTQVLITYSEQKKLDLFPSFWVKLGRGSQVVLNGPQAFKCLSNSPKEFSVDLSILICHVTWLFPSI